MMTQAAKANCVQNVARPNPATREAAVLVGAFHTGPTTRRSIRRLTTLMANDAAACHDTMATTPDPWVAIQAAPVAVTIAATLVSAEAIPNRLSP